MRTTLLALLIPAVSSAAPPAAEPSPALAARMHESWNRAEEARDRLIAGDLDGAKAAAAALADLGPDHELPEAWRPGAESVRGLALELSNAADLPAATNVIGRIGAACGSCHQATDGGPDLENGSDLPPQRWSEGDNMRLHAWSSQWMWLGLVGASDTAWSRGAGSMDDHPIDLRWDEKPPEDGRQELEQLVYVIAGKAVETSDTGERAELYGQLVATCVQCHSKAPTKAGAPAGPE